MHPVLKLINLLPFGTRRRIFKSWLHQLGLGRNDKEWLTRRMVETEYRRKTP